jgi:hypothetical protein
VKPQSTDEPIVPALGLKPQWSAVILKRRKRKGGEKNLRKEGKEGKGGMKKL